LFASRVLQSALAEAGLHELEVGEAGQAEAAAEGEADQQLTSHQRPGQGPAEDRAEQGDGAGHCLVEARRALVDHVGIAPGISGSHA
jgi:hypothetical protein